MAQDKMVKIKTKKIMALWVIALIALLPINSAIALGGIDKFVVKGETNQVEGYIAENEKPMYEVFVTGVSDPDDTLKDRIAIVGFHDLHGFDSCTSEEGGKKCTLTLPGEQPHYTNSEKRNPTARLYGDMDARIGNTQHISELETTYAIDINKPEFVAEPSLNPDDFKILYEVKDTSDTHSPIRCDDYSSGLKSIGFYIGSLPSAPDDIQNLVGEVGLESSKNFEKCYRKSNFEIPQDKRSKFQHGDNDVYAVLEDRLNHEVTDVITIKLDKQPPQLETDSFKIFFVKGGKEIELNHRPAEGKSLIGIKIKITIQDDNLNTATVKANLEDINKIYKGGPLNAQCTRTSNENNKFECVWENPSGQQLIFEPTKDEIAVKISASDTDDNSITDSEIRKQMTVDNNIAVDSISVNQQEDTQYAKSTGNSIGVVFTEDSYLFASDVKIKNKNKVYPADECTKDEQSSKWTCSWKNKVLVQGKLTLEPGTKDILGNTLSSNDNKEIDVVIDNTKPVIATDSITIRGSATSEDPEPPKDTIRIGNHFAITLLVKEENIGKALVDLSEFSDRSDKSAIEGQCRGLTAEELENAQELAEHKKCIWAEITADKPGMQKTVKFKITDKAGNSATAEKQVTVLDELADNVFWKISSKLCSPDKINVLAANVKEPSVFCFVKLEKDPRKIMDNVETVEIRAECTADPDVINPEKSDITRNTPGKTAPVLRFTLKTNDEGHYNEIEGINIDCNLKVFSRVDNRLTKQPQELPVEFELGLFELEDPATALQERINREKEEVRKLGESLGRMRKFMEYTERLCLFFQSFFQVMDIIYAVGDSLAKTQLALAGTGIGKPVADIVGSIRSGVCASGEATRETGKELFAGKAGKVRGGFGKFCSYITSCDTSVWPPLQKIDLWNKYLDKVDEWYGVSLFGQAYGNQKYGNQKGAERNLRDFMKPENSLLSSVMSACVPGIVYNLDKLRQIKCQRVICLEKNTAQGLDPASICDKSANLMYCKYVVGEVFTLIPYFAIWEHYQNQLERVILNPAALISGTIDVGCRIGCAADEAAATKFILCRVNKIIAGISKIFQTVERARGTLANWEGILTKTQRGQNPCDLLNLEEQ